MGSSDYHPQGWQALRLAVELGVLVASCRWALPITTPRPAIRGRPFEPRKAVLCAGLRPTGSHPWQAVRASQSSALRRASPDRLSPLPARPRLAKQCFASGFARPAGTGGAVASAGGCCWRPAARLMCSAPPGLTSCQPVLTSQSSALRRASPDRLGPRRAAPGHEPRGKR